MKFEVIKTDAKTGSKTIEHHGITYYQIGNKNQQTEEEERYFSEWKNNCITFWKDKGNSEMQKIVKATTIKNYRKEVERIFQNYRERGYNPLLKKELGKNSENDLKIQELIRAMTTVTKDFKNTVKKIIQSYKKIENDTISKEAVENFIEFRKKVENDPILKKRFQKIAKESREFFKEKIAENSGVSSAAEYVKMVMLDIKKRTLLEDSELEMQKIVKDIISGDYRNGIKRFFQNYKEMIDNNPNLKVEVENSIEFREKAENDPILKKRFQKIAKEFKVFLKKETFANSGTLPAGEHLIKGMLDIRNRIDLEASELEKQKLVEDLAIGDYRKLFQNHKEIIDNNPNLKVEFEKVINLREKVENDPILKKRFQKIAKEFKVFLKKKIAANSGALPAAEDLNMGMLDIMNRIVLEDSKLEMQKLVEDLAIGDYRKLFQNYKEIIDNNPNLKVEFEKFINLRKKAENDHLLKEKFRLLKKKSKVFLKKEYAANNGALPVTENLIRGIRDIMDRTLFKESELEIQKLVKDLTIGDYRKLFQNRKEMIDNNPNLKVEVEKFINLREKAENDHILKKRFQKIAKESKVFLKKEYAANNGALPAGEHLIKGICDITDRILFKDSKIHKQKLY